jgi:phage terminase large subunit-like protein
MLLALRASAQMRQDYAPQCSDGMVRERAGVLARGASWLADYVTELTGSPGTKYDDQVDSTKQALAHLNSLTAIEVWRRLS